MAEPTKAQQIENRAAVDAAITSEALRRRSAAAGPMKAKSATSTDWIVIGVIMVVALASAFLLGRLA
ncbi:MAG TPA: hypothetical protein PK264_12925 [Hyphomicrobiaceae bacterium]|nr:hypothetical protein [Hyphomicrobiaceae bacterium]